MSKADNRKLAFQFFNEIGIVHQLSVTAFNRRLPEGMHVSHFSAINHLIRLGDGVTPLALAKAFQVTKGTMTNTLSGLERRGLVKMKPHATDGRSKLVFLTAAGRKFHDKAIDSLNPLFAMLEDKMDIGKLHAVLPKLRELRTVLDANRDI